MKKEHKIILGVLIAVALLFVLYRISNRAKTSIVPTTNLTPGAIATNIPQAVQQELNYHNEGETLTYQGVKYTVVGGQWVII